MELQAFLSPTPIIEDLASARARDKAKLVFLNVVLFLLPQTLNWRYHVDPDAMNAFPLDCDRKTRLQPLCFVPLNLISSLRITLALPSISCPQCSMSECWELTLDLLNPLAVV